MLFRSRTGVPDFSVGMVSLITTLADAIGLRRWLPRGAEQEVNYSKVKQDSRPDIDKLLDRIAGVMQHDIRFPSPFPNEKETGGMMTARGLAYQSPGIGRRPLRPSRPAATLQPPCCHQLGIAIDALSTTLPTPFPQDGRGGERRGRRAHAPCRASNSRRTAAAARS